MSNRFEYSRERAVENMVEKLRSLIKEAFLGGHKINEGKNAVIFKLDVNVEGFKKIITDMGTGEIMEDAVSKLLKIYAPNQAKEEYDMQSLAYNTLKKYRKTDKEYAEIPQPFMCKELEVTSELKERLDTSGIVRKEGENVEVIIMDEIDGVDMAQYLYQEVAKRHPSLEYLRKKEIDSNKVELEPVNAADLESLVQGALGYKRLERAGGADAQFRQLSLDADNAKLMLTFLKRKGFKLPGGFLEKISNTISLLHEHGIYHRDLHERNIMVDKQGKVWIIDFDTAVESPNTKDVYEVSEDRHYMNDDTLVQIYKDLGEEKNKQSIADEIQPMIDKANKRFPIFSESLRMFEGEGLVAEDAAGIKKSIDGFLLKQKEKGVKNIPEVKVYMLYSILKKISDTEKLQNIIGDLTKLYPRDFSNNYLIPISRELLK